MTYLRKARKTTLSLLLASSAFPGLALAGEVAPADTGIAANGDIIVTARKVGERLQDIPLSITALTDEQLERRDVSDMEELAKASPGITFNQGVDRSYGAITFRGMRNNLIGDPTRENSSIFIDGIYYISTPAAMNMDDVERVEVVKGPQSAFFGRSTFGGAINFITKSPTDEFQADLFLRAATYDHYEARAAVQGAIVPGLLAIRASGKYEWLGGMYDNVATGGKLGQQETKSGSIVALFTPAPGLSIRGRAAYVDQDDGAPASQMIGRLPTHNCLFGGENSGSDNTLYCGVLQFSGDAAIAEVTPAARDQVPALGNHRNFTDLSLNVTYEFGDGWSIQSLTGRQVEKLNNVDNYTHADEDIYDFWTIRESDSWSEELRLASPQTNPLRGQIGLYYIDQSLLSNQSYIIGEDNDYPYYFGGVGTVTAGSPLTKTVVNKAIFGSLEYDITDQLTLSLEGRYQIDKVTNTSDSSGVTFKTKKFLPRAILDYKITPDIMVYGSIAKGNKPTTANSAVVALSADRQAIAAEEGMTLIAKEETITNYEIGIKTRFFDDRITLNADVFYADWKNKQTSTSIYIDFDGDGVIDISKTGADREYFYGVVVPQGDETVTGFEIDASFIATPELTLSGSFAYTNPNFKSPTISDWFYEYYGSYDASGQQESMISKYQASVSADYRREFGNGFLGFFRSDLNFQSSRYATIMNAAETGDAYILNLKAGFETGPYTVTFYVDNALQDKTVLSLSGIGDSGYDQLGFNIMAYEAALPRKRQFGVTVAAHF